jgi:hypothetical protein
MRAELQAQQAAPGRSGRAGGGAFLVGVVAALLVVVTGVMSVASVSSSGGGRDGGRTLRLRTTLVSSAVNDAGHGGVANVSALRFSVQRRDGSAAGEAWISCVIMEATQQLCHGAFVLANGQIEAQVATSMTATTFTAAITGGTGAFEGANGQIDNVMVAPGVIDRTFHLLSGHS